MNHPRAPIPRRHLRLAAAAALAVVALAATALPAAGAPALGGEYGREVSLGDLPQAVARDIYDSTLARALVELSYDRAAEEDATTKFDGFADQAFLVVDGPDGARRELVIGLKEYAVRGFYVYLWGRIGAEEAAGPNPDVGRLAALIEASVRQHQLDPPLIPVRELSYTTYQLSCIDPPSCIEALAKLGYNTEPPADKVSLAELPAVVSLGSQKPSSFVGAKTPISEKTLDQDTISVPENRLMIIYHSSQAPQVGRLLELLEGTLDTEARQVMLEGMMIELTESAFKELGVEWQILGTQTKITFLEEGDLVPFTVAFQPTFTDADRAAESVRATLRAIIQEGRGEILSNPSVLVLNNRNAKIEVIQEIPIIETLITERTQNLQVKFVTVGIILNIKPRISQDEETVAMQILVEVSEAPEEDFLVIEGQAVAPLVSRRKVETIARVHDNMPFIIGGLIRNERARAVDRIPILSRIPILGVLFQRRADRREKREVIIVLTPRVLRAEGGQRPAIPKDSSRFDFLDNRLFRNSYRLKREDVFDLDFLKNNATILDAFVRARRFVREHPDYADVSPFRELSAGTIPGEDAVVVRMIYEIVKKLDLHRRVAPENLIFFEDDPNKPAGFGVTFLSEKVRELAGAPQEATPQEAFAAYLGRQTYPRKVLLFRYDLDPGASLGDALRVPVATVEEVTVHARQEVEDILLRINRIDEEDGRYHHFAFILDTPSDLERLQAAVVLREVARVNAFGVALALRNFRVGRRIVIPELGGREERIFLIDHEVAEYFFKSDYYYTALEAQLEQGYWRFSQVLAAEGER